MSEHHDVASGERILSVEGLTTQFNTDGGAVRAVDGISFDVNAGEIVGLVGESGAGKSVTTRSIMRLLDDAGEIVAGEVTYRDTTLVGFEDGEPREEMLSERAIRRDIRGNEIAIIFQDPMESLNPVYTVGEQITNFVELNRDLSGSEAEAEAISMLREVGIPKPEERFDDYPNQFSGGQRQRVLIAMAFACRPNLIIADEPTTALDVTVEGTILDLVSELQAEYGTSFIWVTHDMGVVAEICDRVNVMYLGKIVEQGPVDDIFHDTMHPYTQSLLDSIPRPDVTVDRLDPIEGVMPSPSDPPRGCRFHTRCPDAREACKVDQPRFVASEDEVDHRAACIKHEDGDYWDSVPLPHAEGEGTDIADSPGTEEGR